MRETRPDGVGQDADAAAPATPPAGIPTPDAGAYPPPAYAPHSSAPPAYSPTAYAPPADGPAPAAGEPWPAPGVGATWALGTDEATVERERRERRRRWAGLGGTAAAAALLASLGTASLTGAFDAPVAAAPSAGGDVTSVTPAATSGDAQSVAAAVRESVVALDVTTRSGEGAGSGVIIDGEGHILTNNHVIDGARQIVVSLADGRMFEADVVGADPTTDLAVVRLVDAPDDLVAAQLGSSADLVVGQPVVAVGNPLGLDSTVTTGVISALDRPVSTQASSQDPTAGAVVTNAIQVDAAINPGNSGGPLFDASGRVIGITSSIATLSSESGSIGLGFAIPVDQAADVAAQLIDTGTAEHAFLGVSLSDATATVDDVTRAGAEVRSIEDGAPADEAGLRAGDVITAIDGKTVNGAESLTGYVRQYSSGDAVTLTVVRDGDAAQVDVTLAAREA
ncbi:S1C family serine protease [Georgenia faecalis]|uniref:S1C family serine protease n=1 Tax=Georgenia faecalis TaxID=2483799 RepID=UPI000FD96A0A|nr:trypsin-like peptidase domain-containing protein [Georgenia faecalis]